MFEDMASQCEPVTDRDAVTVSFDDLRTGLGVRIIGGNESEDDNHSIFIKHVQLGGLAYISGRLHEGDEILSINGETVKNLSNRRVVSMLRRAAGTNRMTLVVTRDMLARAEYAELLESRGDDMSLDSETSMASVTMSEPMLINDSRPCTPLSDYSQVSLSKSDPGCYTDDARGHKDPVLDSSLRSLQIFETLPTIMRSDILTSSQTYQDKLGGAAFHSAPMLHCSAYGTRPVMASTPHHELSGAAFVGPSPSPKSDKSESRRRSNIGGSSKESSLARPMSMSSEPSPVLTGHAIPQMGTGGKNSSNSRRSSVSSQARIRVEKLEEALKHIGIDPSLDQQLELRTRVSVDQDGTVSYGEFVSVARELFKRELQERNVVLGSNAKSQRADILRQQAVQEAAMEDLVRVRSERDRLLAELEEVKHQLREKDKHCNKLETDLLVLKTETKEALHENKSLKKKVHLSEQAQKAARSLEQDYEDVVKLLEAENAQLRQHVNKHGDNSETTKRIASMNAELRKAELSVKTYEVATEKLLHFTNLVANNLGAPQSSTHNDSRSAHGDASQASTLQKKRHTPQAMAQEARDVIKLVKALIERDPLPFGWQEVYTHEGNRYYVNEEKAESEMLEKAILAFEPSDEDVYMDTSSVSSPALTRPDRLSDRGSARGSERAPSYRGSRPPSERGADMRRGARPASRSRDQASNASDTLRRNKEPKREENATSLKNQGIRRFEGKEDLRVASEPEPEEPPPDYTDTESIMNVRPAEPARRFINERF